MRFLTAFYGYSPYSCLLPASTVSVESCAPVWPADINDLFALPINRPLEGTKLRN